MSAPIKTPSRQSTILIGADIAFGLGKPPRGRQEVEAGLAGDVFGLGDAGLGVARDALGVDDLEVGRRTGAICGEGELEGLLGELGVVLGGLEAVVGDANAGESRAQLRARLDERGVVVEVCLSIERCALGLGAIAETSVVKRNREQEQRLPAGLWSRERRWLLIEGREAPGERRQI